MRSNSREIETKAHLGGTSFGGGCDVYYRLATCIVLLGVLDLFVFRLVVWRTLLVKIL